jgi:hypothetical protein
MKKLLCVSLCLMAAAFAKAQTTTIRNMSSATMHYYIDVKDAGGAVFGSSGLWSIPPGGSKVFTVSDFSWGGAPTPPAFQLVDAKLVDPCPLGPPQCNTPTSSGFNMVCIGDPGLSGLPANGGASVNSSCNTNTVIGGEINWLPGGNTEINILP